MDSRGAWCQQPKCLNHVDAGGWGQNTCSMCRGYFCPDHWVYATTDRRGMYSYMEKVCLSCLEVLTQQRIGV